MTSFFGCCISSATEDKFLYYTYRRYASVCPIHWRSQRSFSPSYVGECVVIQPLVLPLGQLPHSTSRAKVGRTRLVYQGFHLGRGQGGFRPPPLPTQNPWEGYNYPHYFFKPIQELNPIRLLLIVGSVNPY